jgi:hypothetical protein
MNAIRESASKYLTLGYSPIPLDPRSKDASIHGWQRRKLDRLWRDAKPDSNLGLRGGGDVRAAFLDCDEKNQLGTFDHAVTWLAGLGVTDYPIIQTASGIGRQIYVTFSGGLPGEYRKLKSEFGAGEFRYGQGAYVCAPPSVVTVVIFRPIMCQ